MDMYGYVYMDIHTMEYYSATKKKKGNPAINNNMDGP